MMFDIFFSFFRRFISICIEIKLFIFFKALYFNLEEFNLTVIIAPIFFFVIP